MNQFFTKFGSFFQEIWFRLTVPKPLPPLLDEQGLPASPPTPEEAKRRLRTAITNYVADGWSIEIENEFDAVLSKKAPFHWVGKLIFFLLLLLIFAPIALFYLIVVIVKGVNAKPARLRVWIDAEGRVQRQ
jgi:hypothetical protein